MYRFDQLVVDRGGNVIFIQRTLKGIGIFPSLGKELQLLVLGIENGRSGILETLETVVQLFIGIVLFYMGNN